jgi:hypothetical protein
MSGTLVLTTICLGACALGNREPLDQRAAERWIGKSEGELRAALGEPTDAIPFTDTGGKMPIYAAPNRPHYVFETDGTGRIAKPAKDEVRPLQEIIIGRSEVA